MLVLDYLRPNVKRVLVTGGAGFIGTHLCTYLYQNDYQVVSLDCNHLGTQPWDCIDADIRDMLQFDEVDTIVHLAAQVSVPQSITNPDETLSVNVDGTSSIIKSAEASDVKRIIFASSAAVYGDSQQIPTPETAPLMPQSPYAVSKIVGEEILRQSKLDTCSLRFFNVYGQGQSKSGGYAAVIPSFQGAIESDKPCIVHGDGTQSRDFINIHDLVRIIGLVIEAEHLPSELNVASGKSTSILDLIEILGRNNPKMKTPIFEEKRMGDIHTSIADITLLNTTLQIGDLITIEEGLM